MDIASTQISRRSQWPRGLRPLACWNCGFETRRGHGSLFLVSFVCCQVEVSAPVWLYVQRSPTQCGVSECEPEASTIRHGGGEEFFQHYFLRFIYEDRPIYGLQTESQALVCCVKTNEHKRQNMKLKNQIFWVHSWHYSKQQPRFTQCRTMLCCKITFL
jgi:hypothetical protein